ncbi:MAG: ectoine/hydroxyectoine ABC transporter substrate-binding protein EhuB, partial [Chloroflexi bacterium]
MSDCKKLVSRRDTLRWLAAAGGGALLAACGSRETGAP